MKDGKFVHKKTQPWVEKIGQEAFNVWTTNGGSNMVLAGKHLKAQYPRLHLHRGIDHGMSLTLEEIAKIPEIYLIFLPPKMKELLMMPTYWDLATRISKAVYFFLCILHIGDSKEPGFDCLYYYIRRMEQHLVEKAKEINLADMDCSDAFLLEQILCFRKGAIVIQVSPRGRQSQVCCETRTQQG